MTYRIEFLDNDGNQLHGYLEAVSPYWAQLQFSNDYDFEVTKVTEWHEKIEDGAIEL